MFAFSMTGAAVLRQLLAMGANIAGVYTYEDNPKENWFESVKKIALTARLPVFTPDDLTPQNIANIKNIKPDIILSVYYRSLLPDEVLNVARLGAFNMHGSLLPKYRGRAPINWVLVNGEKETGATLHYMTARADAGDIVDRERVQIDFKDTALTLTQKVTAAAVAIIKRSLHMIEAGTAPRVKQDMSQSTYFGRRTPEDGRINWADDEMKIYNLIRAVAKPFPGAFANIDGKKTFVWRARPLDEKSEAKPGDIISKDPLVVATGGKDLQILEYTTGD